MTGTVIMIMKGSGRGDALTLWLNTFRRKGMLVFTPRMRCSRRARRWRANTSAYVAPRAVT